MIFEHDFEIGVKDVGKNDMIKNRAIIEMLEDIGSYHSDLVHYGINDIPTTNVAWILLTWKLKVIDRPKYGEKLHVKTWGKNMTKVFTYRDFEIYDENNKLCIIATSRWALIDVRTRRMAKLNDDIIQSFKPENKDVFENPKIEKIKIPSSYSNTFKYKTTRRDIDINGHMHNLYYLDIAYNALPDDVYYNKRPFDNVEIEYKKEIKLDDNLICKYSFENNKHIIAIYNQDETILHSIISLY